MSLSSESEGKMKISNQGISLIKSFEGFRGHAYLCPAGVWTIGYGHTSGVKPGDVCTESEADAMLRNDLNYFERVVEEVNTKYQYAFTQSQFDALVSFTFNCGSGSLNQLCRRGERTKEEISEAVLLYNKSNGKVLTGLVRRRAAEKKLFDSVSSSNYYSEYTGNASSIDDVFASIGVEPQYIGNWRRRTIIARANGIADYRGSGAQNLKLIRLARQGRLKTPY